MSWHYSQGQGEGFSLESYLDGLRSARSRSSGIQEKSYSLDSGTGSFQGFQFGQTLRRSTAGPGRDWWTWCLEGFPARTYPAREGAPVSPESDPACGDTWRASFARYDRDSSSWKTPQCLLVGGLEPYSETWPRWGTMRSGECWGRVTLAHLTEGIGSGSLRQMATPALAANTWPTPVAHMAKEGGYPAERRRNEPTLTAQAIDRPRWPTPQASDNRDRGCLSTPAIKRRQKKGKQIALSMCASDKCGRLNPHWVAWLMAWPLGWTQADALSAERVEEWRRATLDGSWWNGEPEGVPRVEGSKENRTPRLKALGNGQVPQVAAFAFQALRARLEGRW